MLFSTESFSSVGAPPSCAPGPAGKGSVVEDGLERVCIQDPFAPGEELLGRGATDPLLDLFGQRSKLVGKKPRANLRLPFGSSLGLTLGTPLGLTLGSSLSLTLGSSLSLALGPPLGLALSSSSRFASRLAFPHPFLDKGAHDFLHFRICLLRGLKSVTVRLLRQVRAQPSKTASRECASRIRSLQARSCSGVAPRIRCWTSSGKGPNFRARSLEKISAWP